MPPGCPRAPPGPPGPPGGCFCQPMLIPTTGCLAGAKYVTKNNTFLIFGQFLGSFWPVGQPGQPALAWLACLLCLALAWSGLGLSCLPCQQQQPAAFGGRRRLRRRCCCCWQGRQDRPRPDQAKARHNKQASQAKAGWALGPGPCAGSHFGPTFHFFCSSQNCPKRAPRGPGGPGGPGGPHFPPILLLFSPFPPLWGPPIFPSILL